MPANVMLVPVDLSELSKPLLEFAAPLARRLDLKLEVLHVWAPPTLIPADLPTGADFPSPTIRQVAVGEARAALEPLLRLPALEGLEVVSRVEVGPVVDTLLKRAAHGDVHLVVMATHGRRGLSRMLLGSVTQSVVARSPRPVLTWRAGQTD